MAWLAGQVDYLLFVTGLCFMSAGAAALLARLQNDRSMPWNLFAFSLMGLGSIVWAQLVGYELSDPGWYTLARSALRFACWVLLVEFGRRVASRRGGRPISPIVTVVLATAALLAALAGTAAFSIATQALLALPGAALAVVGMWGADPDRHAGIRAGLRVAAFGVGASALIATYVYAVNIGGSAYVSLWGLPTSLFAGAGALAVFVGLAIYSAFRPIEQTGLYNLGTVAKGISILPVMVALAIGALIATSAATQSERNLLGASLMQRARTAAAALEAQTVGRLTGTPADSGTTDYAAVVDELDRMRFANPDVSSLYVVRLGTSGDVVFLAGSGARSVSPGAAYDGATAVLKNSLRDMGPATEQPTATVNGSAVVSSYGQIRSPSTGAFVGLLGLDIAASDWFAGIASARLTSLSLAAAISMIALFFFSLSQIATYAISASATSERRLRRVLERAPDGIVLLDGRDWRVLEANPRAVEMLELPEEELRGKSFEGFLRPPAAGSGEVPPDACSIDKGVGEWRLKTSAGTELAIELTTAPLELAAGETTLAFLHDVTARRRAEAELHDRITLENLIRAVSSRFIAAEPGDIDRFVADALATFGTFFGVGRTYVYKFSPDMSVMSKTHEWCAEGVQPIPEEQVQLETDDFPWLMERLRNNEFVHVPRVSAMPPEARSEQRAIEARDTHSTLIVPMTSGWRASGFLAFDSTATEREWSGERIALISVLADVFASAMRRARAEEELAKLSLAVTQSPAATVITDADGTIEYVNPRFRELSGYAIDELVKRNPRILKSGEVSDDVYADMWDTITSGRQWRGELVNRRKDGALYWVQASISPVRDAHGEIHFVGVQEDISVIKEAEAALSVAAEAANAANRAKSDFLATMSHEIRTPMNAIIGMAELLEETPLDDEQTRYVRVFRSAGESLLTLINDVLDLSKIEAGRLELDPREFDVERLVEETAEVLAVRAREKSIELLCSVGTDVPARLVGDPDRLRQVLVNLMGNAVKFTSEGHVLVSVVRADGAPDDGIVRLAFTVTDTGIGIPAAKIEGIFDAFTQADSSTTRRYGGTGLGLAISTKLVALMGGEIGASSEEGKGSSFTFDAEFGPAEASITADGVSGLEGVRALVVDDNSANRLIERQYLEGAGAHVDEAEDGAAALAAMRAAKKPYDIALLDLRMPSMSGIQVAERVHGSKDLRGVQLLIVSSDSRPGDAQRARDAGARALLMKPVRRRDLVSAVRAAIDGATVRKVPSVAPKAPSPAATGAALRILLVEDTEDNRILIKAYLRNTEHTLTMAENGEEAVEAYKAAGPAGLDLVLMDMQMPVMDGYAATTEIRRIERDGDLPHTPIVALTAFALPQEAKEALDAGCDEYLTKPIKKATLLEALARYAGVEA